VAVPLPAGGGFVVEEVPAVEVEVGWLVVVEAGSVLVLEVAGPSPGMH
jgi:hypothetical protein